MTLPNNRAGLALAFTIPLSACAGLNDVDLPEIAMQDDVVSAASVVASTICEMEEAAIAVSMAKSDPSLASLEVGTIFTLTVGETNSGGGNVSIVAPVGVTNVTISGGVTPKAIGKRIMAFEVSFPTGTKPDCEPEDFAKRGLTRIAPGLGLSDAIDQWADLGLVTAAAPKPLKYTVSFDVTNTLNAGASATGTAADGRKSTFGFAPSQARQVVHSLVLTISKRPAATPVGAAIPSSRQDELIDEAEALLDRISD